MPIQLTEAPSSATGVFLYSAQNPASGLVNTTSAQTLMAWLNAPTAVWTNGSVYSMVGMYDGTFNASTTPTSAIQIGTRGGNGVAVWTWGGTNMITTVSGDPGVITPTVPANNTWTHVAYTCTALSGTQQHSIYINGVLVSQLSNATQVSANLTQVYINGYPQAGGGGLETSVTQVDDVRVYSRVLSQPEIQTIYNARGARDGIVANLVAYYTFEEGPTGTTATQARDISASRNELVVQNNGGTALSYIAGLTGQNTRPVHV